MNLVDNIGDNLFLLFLDFFRYFIRLMLLFSVRICKLLYFEMK